MTLAIIVAVSDDWAIGKDNDLLWRLPNDFVHFKTLTMGSPIIMGRRTFESLPKGALPGRKNIVLSTNPSFHADGVTICKSVDQAIEEASSHAKVFVIGGGAVYRLFLPNVTELFITQVHHLFPDADTHFPLISPDQWTEIDRETHPADENHSYPYTFIHYKRT